MRMRRWSGYYFFNDSDAQDPVPSSARNQHAMLTLSNCPFRSVDSLLHHHIDSGDRWYGTASNCYSIDSWLSYWYSFQNGIRQNGAASVHLPPSFRASPSWMVLVYTSSKVGFKWVDPDKFELWSSV